MAVPKVSFASDKLEEWKTTASQPWGTVLLDGLSLFHPIVWWRIVAFKRIDIKPALYSAAAIFLPAAYLSIGSDPGRDSLTTYLCSPWTLAWTWKAAASVYRLLGGLKEMLTMRTVTNPSAWKILASRIEQGKAYRERGYDVYLPNDPTNARTIFFFTGAYVEQVAYAEPASLLADAGYLTVVVSAEPSRIVDTWLPKFNASTLRKLQRCIEKRHGCSSDLVLAGHSLGSFACTKLAPALGVKDIVMWGSAPFVNWMDDISETDIRVLVVQATNDMIIEMYATPDATRRFWELLPASTKRHVIVDGTHSGFGNYALGWRPEFDGIPAAEQQVEAVKVTDDFLRIR